MCFSMSPDEIQPSAKDNLATVAAIGVLAFIATKSSVLVAGAALALLLFVFVLGPGIRASL
jgi:hypothetical protein